MLLYFPRVWGLRANFLLSTSCFSSGIFLSLYISLFSVVRTLSLKGPFFFRKFSSKSSLNWSLCNCLHMTFFTFRPSVTILLIGFLFNDNVWTRERESSRVIWRNAERTVPLAFCYSDGRNVDYLQKSQCYILFFFFKCRLQIFFVFKLLFYFFIVKIKISFLFKFRITL